MDKCVLEQTTLLGRGRKEKPISKQILCARHLTYTVPTPHTEVGIITLVFQVWKVMFRKIKLLL
jgi:hypothetical protein